MSKSKFEIYSIRLKRYFKNLDRIGKMWYILVGFAIILSMSLFSFTVIHHEFYKNLASYFQKTTIKNTISRGSINSSEASLKGVLAVSTNLGTLAIDPSQTGSKSKLLEILSEAVLNEFCSHRTRIQCVNNIASYTRNTEIPKKTLSDAELKQQISAYISKRMETPIESVFLAEILSDESVKTINNLNNPALFWASNNLYVNPTLVQNAKSLALALAPHTEKTTEELEKAFEIRPKRYLEIIRKMSITTRDFIIKAKDKNNELVTPILKQTLAGLKGTQEKINARNDILNEYAFYPFIKIEDNFVRFYPEGFSMGQITGYVDNEWIGQYGIEWYFEEDLQLEAPTQVITKDNMGRPLRDYTSTGALDAQNGVNITLTIDRNIQNEVSKILEKSVKKFRANRWSVVITDPKTGAITAMVNYPSYDPNQYTAVYELEPVLYADYPRPNYDLFGFPLFVVDSENGTISHSIDGKLVKLRNATDDEIENNAIQKFKYKNGYGPGNYQNSVISALYEPGSVFKAFTVAIGLDTGEITPNMTYYDKNSVTIHYGGNAKTVIKNYSQAKCGGRHTYTSALNWSCNIGMIDIIEKIGRSLFDSYIRNFGFWAKTNVTMDGEVYSQIAPYDRWSRAQFFTMSFGQWISTTMLQMASAYNVLANGGIYMKPYIVESITYPDGKTIENTPIQVRRVIKEETSKTITAMLVDGVRHGYAQAGAVPGYTMAGKTGTSQIPYKGTYENLYFNQAVGHTVTSYGGYAPAYNPKFVMIVMLERPRTSGDSEKTAAVLYAEIAEYLLKYYKIPKWQE